MNCLMCGEEMETHTGNVRYEALPGAILKGVRINECPNCGEREIEIPRIAELNRVLAKVLICQAARLTGPEIRFLRKHLGLAGCDFADRMGVSASTVSRWEAGKQKIGPSNDRLLRMMVAYEEPVEDYTDQLANVAREEPKQDRPEVNIREKDHHWQPDRAVRA